MTARRNGRVAGALRRDFANQLAQVIFFEAVSVDPADKPYGLRARFPDKLALRPPAIMRRGG